MPLLTIFEVKLSKNHRIVLLASRCMFHKKLLKAQADSSFSFYSLWVKINISYRWTSIRTEKTIPPVVIFQSYFVENIINPYICNPIKHEAETKGIPIENRNNSVKSTWWRVFRIWMPVSVVQFTVIFNKFKLPICTKTCIALN